MIIAVAATLLRRQAGFAVATTAYALYAATLLAIYFGKLPAPEAQQQAGDPIYRLTYNLVVHFVGFYAVAVLTSLLAGRASRAERELEEKRESLADLQVVHRDVIQSITSGLITTDLAGHIASLNRAGEEILGRGEAELVGQPAQELLGTERWQRLTGDGSNAVARPTPVARRSRRCATARTLYLGFSLSPLTDAAGTQRGWNVVFQDLTRWRELEEEVRIKDRMAAVGELAAGIAHEIGNPLAAISGSVQMLARSGAGGAAGGEAPRHPAQGEPAPGPHDQGLPALRPAARALDGGLRRRPPAGGERRAAAQQRRGGRAPPPEPRPRSAVARAWWPTRTR